MNDATPSFLFIILIVLIIMTIEDSSGDVIDKTCKANNYTGENQERECIIDANILCGYTKDNTTNRIIRCMKRHLPHKVQCHASKDDSFEDCMDSKHTYLCYSLKGDELDACLTGVSEPVRAVPIDPDVDVLDVPITVLERLLRDSAPK